jgi:hypothetical protein
VRLDGGPALGQLLVQRPAPGDRLGVPLGLEPRLVLGLLLEQPLGLGARLAQLALGVGAQLVGLDLGVAQELVGLEADRVVDGRAARLRRASCSLARRTSTWYPRSSAWSTALPRSVLSRSISASSSERWSSAR